MGGYGPLSFKVQTMAIIDKDKYTAVLYKRIDGKVQAKGFTGQEAASAAMEDGWKGSPSQCPGIAIPAAFKKEVDEASDLFASDLNVLANADSVEDLDLLITAYKGHAGKKMHHSSAQNLKNARKACKKLLGDINGNG